MTTYTINEQYHGVEIYFDKKPSALTLDTLKGEGFRWHNAKKCWYAKETPERLNLALALANHTERAEEPNTAPAVQCFMPNKAQLREEYAKEWSDPKMIDYCVNKASRVAVMLDGDEIIPIDKQKIETWFCFGESGYDYDDAQNMAHHARTSEEYFTAENLKEFDATIKAIEEQLTDYTSGGYILTIGKHKENRIGYIHYERTSAIIKALGGSAYLAELAGQSIEIWGTTYRIPTAKDLQTLLDAYKEAREHHAKKVRAYLKRYGLSKVHSWTYWREA